ncbi:MAG: glycosyltransferase [Rickettsiaceae bacterium]|nr:glycosyltransferase [Rickettsiaceae bacterium]
MNVLQINAYETPGKRFNGLAIAPLLEKYNIYSKHFVWYKDTDNSDILTLPLSVKKTNAFLMKVEHYLSLQSVILPNVKKIIQLPEFKAADLIHLHIIHNGFISFGDLPKLTHLKPTVWTIHDPWVMTGHCIHPDKCQRWKIGCGSCPDLKRQIPLIMDTTKWLFKYKQKAYKKSKFDLIVASSWMRNMISQSPMFDDTVKTHHVPFGIDIKFFNNNNNSDIREKYNITNDMVTICFRSDDNEHKGIEYIIEALKKIKTSKPICILTIGRKPLKNILENRFKVIDLGWVDNEYDLRNAYLAADMFLMPSVNEAFGLMAVEAMACGKPLIVFQDTALPDVTFAPEVGISVPKRDVNALKLAIEQLIDNPLERIKRGMDGRKIVEKHYDEKLHAKQIADIYHEIVNR